MDTGIAPVYGGLPNEIKFERRKKQCKMARVPEAQWSKIVFAVAFKCGRSLKGWKNQQSFPVSKGGLVFRCGMISC